VSTVNEAKSWERAGMSVITKGGTVSSFCFSYCSCVFIQDPKAPAFSLTEPLYALQLQKQLRMNVYQEGAWGCMRHIPTCLLQNTKYLTEFAQVQLLKQGDLSALSWVQGPLKFYKYVLVFSLYPSNRNQLPYIPSFH
jgi:hypothetical protein